jgi:GNAT superfamily N-acetyltransferase
MLLRAPTDGDAPAIARLMGQLGYPSGPDDVLARLAAMRRDSATSEMWVAELDGRVVGMATAKELPSVHVSTPVVWLTVLVVDESVRGRGVGRRLVAEAEAWARVRGAPRISLTSAVHRKEAHEFYVRLGYTQTGVRLTKYF